MSVTLTLNNTTFIIPSPGEDPGWGEDTTAYLEEIATVLGSLSGSNDILETSFTLANNISSATNITGLNFSTASVRAAVIEYSIYRSSSSTTSGSAETGVINLVYDTNAASGSKWLMMQEFDGDAGVTFDVTDTGQITYTSTDIGSTSYTGIMKFKARTLSQ